MSYQIEFRHFKYFLAVAEDLHFRKAAERLYISQPGLSRQIKQMEDDLGIILFERHNRKVQLTNAGIYLKNELTLNLKNIQHTLNHAKSIHKGDNGSLKMGYVGSAMQNIIPDLLLKFRTKSSNIILNLNEMGNQKQIDELLSNNLDVGFVRLERVPRSIAIRPILKESFCLVLPEDHSINKNNFKDITQLKNESFILFDPKYSTSYFEKIMQIFDDGGFSPLVTHKTIHASSIYKLVENGFGISIVPKSLMSEHQEGIKFIELNKTPHQTTLSVVWNKTNRNPVLNLFLEHIVK
ncbi:LysR family transcriptional regulator [Flavobacteriaceae bacterium AU392]|nr:LysR family transcriptional regulator [Flavobacteriaceae bacterium]RKM81452.1 LysR family transcriptional regulator [Flavobacteriaceae bacterium AU392]